MANETKPKSKRRLAKMFTRIGSKKENNSSTNLVEDDGCRPIISPSNTGSRRSSFISKNSSTNSLSEVKIDPTSDPTSPKTFGDWLLVDPRYGPDCFQIIKYKDSENTKLTLEGQSQSEEDNIILPELLKNDSDLTWLSLGASKLGIDGCKAIIDALIYNTTLKHICLSFNDIDVVVCSAINEMLSLNSTLTSIDLKNNKVGDDGFVTIMEALLKNNSISNIDLRRNNITGDSCHAMRDMLLTNTALQKFELRGNSIANNGACIIAEGLHSNTTLAYLTLERNHIDADILKGCTDILDRNKVIKCHRESIESFGISFYVTINDEETNKPYLTWANNDAAGTRTPEFVVDEAAKTANSLALCVLTEILHKILDPKIEVTSHSSDEEFNEPIMRLMRDRQQLRKLLNTKINDNTYLLHTIAKSEHPLTLDMLKFLVDRCDASFYTLTDNEGSTARAIAFASGDKAKKEWANTHGSFLGRYTIEGGKGIFSNPVHKSRTSIVHFAHDVTKLETDPHYYVAVKIMTDEETFTREQHVRLNDDQILSTLSSGDDIPESLCRYDADTVVPLYRFHSETDVKGQHYQCLIFEKMGKNLDYIIDSELIAGKDERVVSWYGKGLAKAIQHIHSKGYIHADLKPRNVIRDLDKALKLIDLDNSVPMGGKLIKECSSAFVSPEIARALFGPNEECAESIQERIIEHQSMMAQLDLSKKDDIDTYHKVNGKIETLLASKSVLEKTRSTLLADESVDIWAFGVIMYYLCIGKSLFLYDINDDLANESEKNRLLTWQGLSRATLDEVAPVGMSKKFRDNAGKLLIKCLHVDPKERFQSMEEIINHNLFCDVNE